MKTMGMKFGENLSGAGNMLKGLFGKAKQVAEKAGGLVDAAMDKAMKASKVEGPHIEVVDTIHMETKIPESKQVREETPLPSEGEKTGWFNVDQ